MGDAINRQTYDHFQFTRAYLHSSLLADYLLGGQGLDHLFEGDPALRALFRGLVPDAAEAKSVALKGSAFSKHKIRKTGKQDGTRN